MKSAAESLVGQVDTIVIVQDNTVISALEAVLMVGEENQIPVFTMDIDSVERGAIASLASDPYREGQETAEMIAKILLGGDAGAIAPMRPTQYDVHVNLGAAERMGVAVPQAIVDQAVQIFEWASAQPLRRFRVTSATRQLSNQKASPACEHSSNLRKGQ